MTQYRKVSFPELFERIERKTLLDDTQHYRCVGVRWYGLGAFVRNTLLGAEISRKQQWIIRSGDIVYNKLFAWKGAFAIADSTVDGCIVSDKFPTYRANSDMVDLRWLAYYFRTPTISQQAEALSKGAAAISKLTLNPPQFWDLSVPLPSLPEQRQIVEKIDRLASRISEARSLRAQAAEAVEALLLAELGTAFRQHSERFGSVRLGELLIDAGYGSSEKCDSEPIQGGIPVLRIPNIVSERIGLTDLKYARLSEQDRQRLLLQEGDILVVRTNGSLDLVGRSAVVPRLEEPFAFASYLIRLRLDRNRVDPDYAQRILQHLRVAGVLMDFARTTAGQYNVSLGRLRAAGIPLPPISEQRRIVAELDALQTQVDALNRLQSETAAELDALLPSILDKAFRGEL